MFFMATDKHTRQTIENAKVHLMKCTRSKENSLPIEKRAI